MGKLNEIEQLHKMLNVYRKSNSDAEVTAAENYLRKVHKKYGTIDIPTIQNLIK
jgi:hypothetical protein